MNDGVSVCFILLFYCVNQQVAQCGRIGRHENELELLLRIAIACVLGFAIGHERRNHNKSAGIRPHAIVALGSALMMVASKYGFADVADYDASRVAAQIVSGIGFLGAGMIFVRNNLVNGLTTAAGIWATAGVGMAMGAGLYVISIASAGMIIIAQEITHLAENENVVTILE